MDKDERTRLKYEHMDKSLLPHNTSTSPYPTSLSSPAYHVQKLSKEFVKSLQERKVTMRHSMQVLYTIEQLASNEKLSLQERNEKIAALCHQERISLYSKEVITDYMFEKKWPSFYVHNQDVYIYQKSTGNMEVCRVGPHEWEKNCEATLTFTTEGKFILKEWTSLFEQEIIKYEQKWKQKTENKVALEKTMLHHEQFLLQHQK